MGRFGRAARDRRTEDLLVVRKCSRRELPEYLTAANVGLLFVRPSPSRTACSPVKNGEYLACGLPVVTPADIGDYSRLIDKRNVGIVLDNLSTEQYRKGALRLRELRTDAGFGRALS